MATSEAPGGFTGELTFGLDPESSVAGSEGMWTCRERSIMGDGVRVPEGTGAQGLGVAAPWRSRDSHALCA